MASTTQQPSLGNIRVSGEHSLRLSTTSSAPSMPRQSTVSVRLSEPVSTPQQATHDTSPSAELSETVKELSPSIRRMDSYDMVHGMAYVSNPTSPIHYSTNEEVIVNEEEPEAVIGWQEVLTYETDDGDEEEGIRRSRSNSSSTQKSEDSATVAWSELERAEATEAREDGADEATAFLLARLEQENNALATDPRFGLRRARSRKQSRPPSIQMLKRLVQDPNTALSRYSQLPNPPPMTELEFWAAIVQDYPQTAQRLPTLTSSKIKAGVPPPLRGVVWVSMAGARDRELGVDFARLSLEPSPYENLIGKDVGRSFPGVEMFRDPEGEGQQMLGRVLKCFSLYDKEIGYCQGLGFLVGPLLMQMGDKDAFCVLVRLMENYDLRSCFTPSLSGLHLRIFQFQRLLTQHLPTLAAHLASLQVEAAYLTQWFLSFFAVTCPLPMLFRIYDVIFAEGASETIMRVALSLMRRNESRLMASTDFEEVMHILLSRALWDTYASNADDLVNDFMDMRGVVTTQSLKSLENAFKDAQTGDEPAWFAFLPDATATASRFLGRLWTATTPAKTYGLSPAPASSFRPGSFLRRSPSTSTFTSNDPNHEGTTSIGTFTTDATVLSRESANRSITIPVPSAVSKEDKDLHSQIEDLLTALSEMQRQNALLSSQLQKEREDRDEDHRAFHELIEGLKEDGSATLVADRRQTLPHPLVAPSVTGLPPELSNIIYKATERLTLHDETNRSSVLETKQRLRESLLRSRDQLHNEMSRSAVLNRQLDEQEQEMSNTRDQLREAQTRIQDGFREKQKLERTIQEMQRTRSRSSVTWSDPETPPPMPYIWRSDTSDSRMSLVSTGSGSGGSANGLREFKLGRPGSGAPTTVSPTSSGGLNPVTGIPRRTTSLATQAILSTEDHIPADEDALLVELVNAKTSEAIARQELEEVKGKLDALRKMLGVPSVSTPPANTTSTTTKHRPTPSDGTLAAMMTPLKPTSGNESRLTPQSSASGSFWGWGKRSASVASTTTER